MLGIGGFVPGRHDQFRVKFELFTNFSAFSQPFVTGFEQPMGRANSVPGVVLASHVLVWGQSCGDLECCVGGRNLWPSWKCVKRLYRQWF